MDAGALSTGERARLRGPRQEPQVPAPRAWGFWSQKPEEALRGARSLHREGSALSASN